ncbi:MAG: hypothetical protein ACR2OW_14450 [Methyloligellaceae bacterium]
MTDTLPALRNRLLEISEEIRSFTGPIPACDVHFNALLEERRTLSHRIRDLTRNSSEVNAEPLQNQQ